MTAFPPSESALLPPEQLSCPAQAGWAPAPIWNQQLNCDLPLP